MPAPRRLMRAALCACLLLPVVVHADTPKTAPVKTVAEVAAAVKESVVVLLYTGRDGRPHGLGSGFVVSADGLIATNLHVIGEGRPITVLLPDGSKHQAVAVHASDRKLDLAVVRIAAKKLRPLPLGDAAALKQGQPLVALGHPRGLKHSVVAGVLSGRRAIEGVEMLQLAVPIEQGNSGGPVLDMTGRVVGVVSMKSQVTPNLGFAVPAAALKKLLDRPNTVPMTQWLTLGALDPDEWRILYDGHWRQRAGHLIADGAGSGFGGRTLVLRQRPALELPFELAVTVKLEDEAGAAGLVFGGDGRDRHYGFYPSGGKLRLTRFDGDDVYSWKVIKNVPSPAYRPGEWNTLKVRLEKNKITCFVNDAKLLELNDPNYAGTALGLTKFRAPGAEFKNFRAARHIAPLAVADALKKELTRALASIAPATEVGAKELAPLLKHPGASTRWLRARARALEEEAARMRTLAQAVHHERCLDELGKLARADDAKIDLARAALLIARLDNEELDIDAYSRDVARLARQASAKMPKDATPVQRAEALSRFLFKERGFHGSRHDYYARANSYLNEVLDDREGLPITLSVLYIELARRLDLKVVGVALPGHFVVRHEPPGGPAQLLDVFEGGTPLTKKDAQALVERRTGQPAEEADFAAVSKKAILSRMLHNLLGIAERERDRDGMLRYLDALLALDPDAHTERWARAVFRYQAGRRIGALADCDRILEQAPAGADLERVRALRRALTETER